MSQNIAADAWDAAIDAAYEMCVIGGTTAEDLKEANPYRKAEPDARVDLLRSATSLISELTEHDDCHFDHHGDCQAHGFHISPGELCPQHKAKEWALTHSPFTDDGVTYCGWDRREGCGEQWPCSTVRNQK